MTEMGIVELWPKINYEGNYPEDYKYGENQYANRCSVCKRMFFGGKGRFVCKKCIQSKEEIK